MKKYLIITCVVLFLISAFLAQSLVEANKEKTQGNPNRIEKDW